MPTKWRFRMNPDDADDPVAGSDAHAASRRPSCAPSALPFPAPLSSPPTHGRQSNSTTTERFRARRNPATTAAEFASGPARPGNTSTRLSGRLGGSRRSNAAHGSPALLGRGSGARM
eukprot:scaffold7566_cov122-Isochrysis_galbana.AAC.2